MKINKFVLESFYFIVCVGIILAIGYFTGYLEGFTPKHFERAFYKISNDISSLEYFKDVKINQSKNLKYKSFTVRRVPQDAIDGSNYSRVWTQLFTGRKVVFYIYDNNSEINQVVQEFMSSQINSKRYNVQAYSTVAFDNMRVGEIGPSKICNSLEECNNVRRKAATYSYLSNFLKNCGKTACIFKGNQYVQAKNPQQLKLMLNELKNW